MDSLESTLDACGLFEGLGSEARDMLRATLQEKKFPEGHVLIRKDAVPQSLYIIREGSLGIYNEDVLLASLVPPAVIGESCIAGTPATATSIAGTGVSLIEITREGFFRMAAAYPHLIQNLFALSLKRLRASNDAALQESRTREQALEKIVGERTAELSDTLAELRRTQKFRDQFLANMSHEIRTPMNAIVGLTNLLVKTPLNSDQEKYLQVIRKSGENLLVIINDILDLSKIEAGKLELEHVPFPLHRTLQNVREILALKANEKKIGLELEIGKGVPEYVLGDETRLTQIIMNLAGNAIKFTEKGMVTLSLHKKGEADKVVALTFAVKDTGIGIPADKLEKIFESFGQASSDTTRKFGGTGLGLSISRQLVELHGGHLQVESEPGKGSTFFFTLDYTPAQAPDAETAASLEEMPDMAGKKILLVEDNPFNQLVANDTIVQLFPGVLIDVAETGQSAIDLASANDYDIILMDIHLPDINGYEATRFIRRELRAPKNAVPVCALTASVSREQIDACMEAGMNDYMPKPFSPEILREKIRVNVFGKK